MRCPSCDHHNRPDRRFCAECGAALAALCVACGASNEPGEKFCGGCGERLPPAAAAPGAPTPTPDPDAALPAGERRQLSVLFCDLVGSTPLSQQLDAEEWRDLIAQYQQAASGAVGRFGGHIARKLGDGLLIYFGEPMDADNFRSGVWEPLLTTANMRKVRLHDLRHTYASQLLQEGTELLYVSQQLGHHSGAFTLSQYGHLMPRDRRGEVNRLDRPATSHNPAAITPSSDVPAETETACNSLKSQAV